MVRRRIVCPRCGGTMRAALEAVIVFHPCRPPRPRLRSHRVELPEATVPTRAEVSYEAFHGEPAPNYDAFAAVVPGDELLRRVE